MRSHDSDFVRLYVDSEGTSGVGNVGSRSAGNFHVDDHREQVRDEVGVDLALLPSGEQVLSIEDLAQRFNVSTKTISRWRDHGLVAQRYVVDGRRRVGFLASTVERFIRANPMRIERGSRFSQLSEEEHDKIISWARRLALAGACPADVHRRIAARLDRSVETIRYTIKRHDQDHPEDPVFAAADGRLRPEACGRIYEQHMRQHLSRDPLPAGGACQGVAPRLHAQCVVHSEERREGREPALPRCR